MTLITENIYNLSLFKDSQNLIAIYFSKEFEMKNITSLAYLFGYCSNLLSIDISNLNFTNIESMKRTFS